MSSLLQEQATRPWPNPFTGSGQGRFVPRFQCRHSSIFHNLILIKDTQNCIGICSAFEFADIRRFLLMASTIIRPFNRKLLPERLGHEVIDSDHMEISNWWFRVVNCVPLQFTFLIARMKKLMEKHFAREAEIMKCFDMTLCACHQKEHDALLQFCADAAKVSQYNWALAQRALRRDFPDIFANT